MARAPNELRTSRNGRRTELLYRAGGCNRPLRRGESEARHCRRRAQRRLCKRRRRLPSSRIASETASQVANGKPTLSVCLMVQMVLWKRLRECRAARCKAKVAAAKSAILLLSAAALAAVAVGATCATGADARACHSSLLCSQSRAACGRDLASASHEAGELASERCVLPRLEERPKLN